MQTERLIQTDLNFYNIMTRPNKKDEKILPVQRQEENEESNS